jgi:16S rRNA (uracil1498-N3)-methyltransferase
MPRFFVRKEQIENGFVTILGDDAHHISRSLRMATGEKIVVSDGEGMDYDCLLEQFNPATVVARIISSKVADAEMPVRVHLFSALPKGEKLDLIIQKSVECGVFDITPFESERCVVKVKADAEERKTERRNKIALEAAKQCGRSIPCRDQTTPCIIISRD